MKHLRLDGWLRVGLPALAGLGLVFLARPGLLVGQSSGNTMPLSVSASVALHGSADDPVTYSKHVAPIFQRVCQDCHRAETAAPFALLTYEDAKMFAPLIKLRVLQRTMPPWPIDKTVGIQEFKNDISLTDEEIATVARWVDQGAQRGNPADEPPPRTFPSYQDTWAYEKVFGRPPDFFIRSPVMKVPANGLDQWLDPEVTVTGLEKERWIRAIEIRPGNPKSAYVFHHGNPSLRQPGDGQAGDREGTGLVASAVGKEGEIYPDDAGKLIKPGAKVRFGMHLYPIGEDVDAVMELGLWFYPEGERPKFSTPGEVQFRADQTTGSGGFPGHSRQIARRADLLIPPHGRAMYQGHYVLNKPARIHSLRGHMHLRGHYQVVQAIYPDGRSEIINKVDWNHRWHTTFLYEDHVRPLLPKGTVLIFTSVFDNTENNPNSHHFDPDQWVVAGSRTVDEMSHIWVGMTYFDNEEDFQRLVAEREQQKRMASEGGSHK